MSEAFVGQAFVGQAFVGQAFMGQAFVGEAFVGQAFVGETFLSSIDEAFSGEAFVLKLCSALIVERDSDIALHHLQMSEFGSPSDGGSPNSNSRFELAMLESSGPLLESCTKNSRLGDPYNFQALANIGYSSLMSVGEGVVCDAIPIFRSEFTADHLVQNLLDSEKQLEALRQSCSIPRSVRMRLVHHEELSSEPPNGHVMFYTQILLTLGVKLPLHSWLQRMLSFIGYALGQLYPSFWDTFIGFYIIWMEYGLGEPSFHQWRYCYKMRPVKACTGYAECACRSEKERTVFVTRGTIKLSGQELADIENVLRVPKEDRHLGKLQPLFRKYGFQALVSKCQRRATLKHRVRPTPKPKLQEEVLKIAASKKVEAEAIGYAATIFAREERRLLPPLPTINPIFPPTMESTDQEGGPSCSRKRKYKEEVGSIHWKDLKVAMQPSSFRSINNFLAGRRSTVDELSEPLDENESDRDWIMRLSSYVMIEYDDRLREVERYKAKFKENKQLVNDARKTSKALVENVKLKKQLEATKEQLETTILEGEAFVLAVDPNSDDDSDNKASISEQSQESEDGLGDAEEGGDDDRVETHSDIVKGSTSDEDDS
ncbi:unnamed protein product [Malus baccata var. baccata]